MTGYIEDHERLRESAQRVLDGDDSIHAAKELEAVLLDEYPSDERFDDLIGVLSRHALRSGHLPSSADEVRRAVRDAVAKLR